MAKRAKDEAGKLEQKIEQKIEGYAHPPQSKAAQHAERALDTLAALLDSQDEAIRLQAAQAILNRPAAATSTSKTTDLVKKITKVL
jgi:hypothetical protein